MPRILITDDHEIARRGIALVVAEAVPGAEVVEAATAEAALVLLGTEAFDLLLLDVDLPGTSGLELLKRVRAEWPGGPVLMITVHAEPEYAATCFRLGAAGYLEKAAGAAQLGRAVTSVLAGGRYGWPGRAGESVAGGFPLESLSRRELEVVRLVAGGRSAKEVAAELSVSEKTVSTYRARIAQKLGLSTAVELTRYALRHGLS